MISIHFALIFRGSGKHCSMVFNVDTPFSSLMWFIRDSIVSKVTDLSLAFVDMPLDTVEKAPNIFLGDAKKFYC